MGARAHVVVVSDRAFSGARPDETAPLLWGELARQGFQRGRQDVLLVPDEALPLRQALISLLALPGPGLILTTGGTGITPRDITPEVSAGLLEKKVPGLAELMRAASKTSTPFGVLSRGLAGVTGQNLLVNLPGRPKGALECLRSIALPMRHALDLLAGKTAHGGGPGSGELDS